MIKIFKVTIVASDMNNIFFNESLKPLNREPVSDYILNKITDYILSGELKPGDKLPTEIEFVEKLGVGRNSFREAIKMLVSLGVVEIKRGAGTFITRTISSSMLNPLILSLAFEQGTSKQLIELRLLLETGAAELVIDKASDEDIGRLKDANRKLKEASDNNMHDSHALRNLDLNVHYILFEITKNPLITIIAKAIYTLFYASIEKTVKIDPLQAYENHQLFIDAIIKRDRVLAKQNIIESLTFWKDFIRS